MLSYDLAFYRLSLSSLARGYDADANDTLTTYVVTRWYRAPELLCNSTSYGKGLDVWSVGCIFAELLTHQPFFRGENPQHQLGEIIRKVGCPSDPSKLSFIESPAAMNQLLAYQGSRPTPPFASFFPHGTQPLAIDLLHKMLQFNPEASTLYPSIN
jgi:mitogen-activated protein kinase 15